MNKSNKNLKDMTKLLAKSRRNLMDSNTFGTYTQIR